MNTPLVLLLFIFTIYLIGYTFSLGTPLTWHPSRDEYLARKHIELKDNLTSSELWPYPVFQTQGSNVLYVLPSNFQFLATQTGPILAAAFHRYRAFFFPWAAAETIPNPSLNSLQVIIAEPYNETLELGTDESYTLIVSLGSSVAQLKANTVFGALKGLETFSQLLQFNFYTKNYQIYVNYILDYPRLAYRGVMLDTARRFMTVSSIKIVIDLMSYYKLNSLHLHIMDTDSWPLVVPGYPNFTDMGAYYPVQKHIYTPTDIYELVTYGLDRGVRIIPEIDTPGHSYTLCIAYPQYCVMYINNGQLVQGLYPDPSNPATYTFLKEILTIIAGMFPSDQFHIGSDEMWFGEWQAAPTVQKFMKTMGWTDINQVLYYYQRQIIEIMRGLGKKIIGWNPGLDNFPANWTNNPNYDNYQDVAFDVWSGWGDNWRPSVEQMTSARGYVILSGPYYVVNPRRDDIQYSSTWQHMYGSDPWNFTQTEPLKMQYMLGGELCAWDDAAITDSGNIVVALTPYLGAVGETWWSDVANGTQPDWYRYFVHRCRTIVRGVPSNPLAGDDIHPYRCWTDYEYPLTDNSAQD